MKKLLKELKGHLMSGISYMLPLIIGSSLVVALPKLLALAMGVNALDPYAEQEGFMHILYLIEQVGWTGIGLVNTVLAGFVAYSIADKPALGAGLVGGMLASKTNAGFLGAVIAAFLAGYIVKYLKEHVHLKGAFEQMMPLVILPLISVGAVAIVMGVILAGPLAAINNGLVTWVGEMCTNGTNTVILALVLGAMIGFDMGGPVNKAAWMAGNVLMLEGIYLPAILVNCAICIPPLGYGIATLLKKSRFSKNFQEAGKGNLVMGFVGITEGAIAYTLVNPAKLIPVNVLGASLGAGIAALLGVNAVMPPVGGIYGFITVGNGWAYLVGLFAGAFIIAILAILLVDFTEKEDVQESMNMDEIELEFE